MVFPVQHGIAKNMDFIWAILVRTVRDFLPMTKVEELQRELEQLQTTEDFSSFMEKLYNADMHLRTIWMNYRVHKFCIMRNDRVAFFLDNEFESCWSSDIKFLYRRVYVVY